MTIMGGIGSLTGISFSAPWVLAALVLILVFYARRQSAELRGVHERLALAKATGAWLITGNLKHYPEELRAGVQVISPAEYLERLSG